MIAQNQPDEINVLKLSLHDRLVGYLAEFKNGRNVLSFDDDFRNDSGRPTFSLTTHPSFPNAKNSCPGLGLKIKNFTQPCPSVLF